MQKLLNFIGNNFFKTVEDADFEFRKLNIIRIILGVVMLVRTIEIIYTKTFIPDYYTVDFFDYFILTLLFLFTIGLFTPVASVLLLFLYWEFDTISQTFTLGSSIWGLFLTLSIFCGGGKNFSIDSYLLNHAQSYLKKILDIIYLPFGSTGIDDIRLVYFTVFFIYGADSLAALTHHLVDVYWYYGQTVQIMMTNSYLSRYYDFFRASINIHPKILFFFSVFSVLGQTIFQLLMIPLIANRIGRKFVVFWGLGFFLSSLFLLQLGALAHIEIGIWFILFFRKNEFKRIVNTQKTTLRSSNLIVKYYSIAVLALSLPFFYNSFEFNKLRRKSHPVNSAIYYTMEFCNRFGYICPVVFNSNDLMMGDNWVEVYKNGKLIPFSGQNGNRLGYLPDYLSFGNHGADNLYFANTLVLRRRIYFAKNRYQKLKDELMTFLDRRTIYDYNRTGETGKVIYEAFLYHNEASHYKIEKSKFEKKLEGRFTITVNDGKVERYNFDVNK